MIETEKVFEPISKAVNNCYETLFPGFPLFPKFSFVRVMTTLWRNYVYSKARPQLLTSFIGLMKKVRERETGLYKENLPKELLEEYMKSKTIQTLGRFVQVIADLSINELSIHYLGSTKFPLEEPYNQLHDIIVTETKYIILLL